MTGQDTIAAISTAMSESGIGIIRISGPDAISAADQVFRAADGAGRLCEAAGYTLHYGYIYDGEQPIDEVLAGVFRAPRSYTAEDTVEINCHGGVYAMRRVLQTVLRTGVRAAQPGEFTKRAFLNGRIDLSRAEAVMDLISAKNEYAMENSVKQLKGALQKQIMEVRSVLLYQTAQIEAALDDPEHYDLTGFAPALRDVITKQMDLLDRMIRTFENGRMLQEGIRTAIVGKPNVGKSSLLNALLGEERAIVTEIAGTTRDVLTETLQLSGVTLQMMDTAGIRETQDAVESIGVERAGKSMAQADLVLFVADTSRQMDADDQRILGMIEKQKVIILLNKSDLPPKTDEHEILTLWEDLHPDAAPVPILSVSAKQGTGMDELSQLISSLFYEGQLSYNDEVIITNLRQKEKLEDARRALAGVTGSIDQGLPEDFYTIDLTEAVRALGEITGESLGEDIINEIFDKFCMGK